MEEKTIKRLDGAEMVLVAAGKFVFGISDEELEQLHRSANAIPKYRNEYGELDKQEVSLPHFYIDKFPVTNSLYRRFMEETSYKKRPRLIDSQIWGDPNHPVVAVDWDDASAYAKWTGKRLPTEREWEKAARGTDGRLFPWGNELEEIYCNCFESGLECTSGVGSFPSSASPYGVQDMAGNVWEMTTDKWDEGLFAMRGGCYLGYQRFCRATSRWAPDPEELRKGPRWLGFRCVYVPG
jgi:formylglycine-generating enzyme required for sulfatase activity